MKEHSPLLKKAILEVVSNQLRSKDPPETSATLNRLIAEGYSKQESLELIGAVVSAHIYDMLKNQRVYDNKKYVSDLNKLPDMPWDE